MTVPIALTNIALKKTWRDTLLKSRKITWWKDLK